MSQDLIRYDLMVQDALRGVVRKVMTDAAMHGLPGDHHFYISFRTDAPGLRISKRLKDKYPEEMTIVLQHQFWDLTVSEQGFEVGLHFSGVPERLVVPFDALTGFFDPSVQFGLKFELSPVDPADNDEDGDTKPKAVTSMGLTRRDAKDEAQPPPAETGEERGADVVSLDAFRKKP